MHYIGMLAFRMPMKVLYDVPTVVVSLLAAIAASAVALFTVSRRQMGLQETIVGGVVMGSGIAAMHYIGMSAMRMPVRVTYNLPLVLTSIVVAVAISIVALVLAFRIRDEKRISLRKVASAIAMGSAIPVMHYAGMFAANFGPSEVSVDISHAVSVSSLGIAVITISTLLILSFVIVGAFLDRLVSAQKDLTEQARNELRSNMRALVESEERLRVVTDNARVGLVIVNQDRRYIYANAAYADLLDLPSFAIVGKRVADVLSGVYEEQIRPRLDRAFAGERVAYELCKPGADGDCHYEITYEPTMVNATVPAVVVVVTDLPERKKAELASLRLAAIVEFSDDAVIGKDLNSIITSWNRGAEKLFGYPASEMVGTSIMRLIPDDRQDEENHILGQIRSGKSVRHFETRRQTKDGRLIDVSVTASSIKDAAGNPIGVSKVARDITQRVKAHEALRRSEAIRNIALESAQLGEWQIDLRTGTAQRSLSHDRIFGYSEILPEWNFDIFMKHVHSEDRERVAKSYKECLEQETKWDFECRIIRSDQDIRWIWARGTHYKDASGKSTHVMGTVEDITERKRAEERMCHLAQAVENGAELIAIADPDGRISFANRALLHATGYQESEIVGQPFRIMLISRNNPPGLDEEIRARTIFDGAWRGECLCRRKDDSEFPVFLSSGQIKDSRGLVIGIFGIAQDITDRKNLEKQLVVSQKMEAVGLLAGGIAHDFNNLLGVIIGYSEIFEQRLSQNDPLKPKAEQIKKAGQRAASLTRQLLAFSRQQVIEPTVLDLNAVVVDTLKMLQRLIGEDIELVVDSSPELGLVKVDKGQIEQVIMNLAVNARDAMPQGGKLTITTTNVELDEVYARLHPPALSGSYVMLGFSDTGCGMDHETQTRIFDPFFTTKEQGKGTGLGLSTVFGVVKQSGGYVYVYSEPGMGATFKIYLPRVGETDRKSETRSGPYAIARGWETVLLVEDSQPLRDLAQELLEESGYTVLEASNGVDAIRIAEQYQRPIHLLMTDVVMPGMNGRILAERMTSSRPGIKVLYMSGYTDDAIVNHGVLNSGIALLQKPFTKESLSSKVREVLGVADEEEASTSLTRMERK